MTLASSIALASRSPKLLEIMLHFPIASCKQTRVQQAWAVMSNPKLAQVRIAAAAAAAAAAAGSGGLRRLTPTRRAHRRFLPESHCVSIVRGRLVALQHTCSCVEMLELIIAQHGTVALQEHARLVSEQLYEVRADMGLV